MNISPDSKLVFHYLDLPHGLGGRGGVQRFFLLSQGIAFGEKLVPFNEEWAAEKARLVETGENPCGSVPVVFAKNNDEDDGRFPIIQHIAGSRYLARVHGVSSGDAFKDYVQDLVADEYQGFRDEWVRVALGGSDEDKKTYRETDVPKQLKKFDALYDRFKTHDTFLSVSAKTGQPLWGDAAVFGLLRDHVLTGLVTAEDLQTYPRLLAMYRAYESIPAVKAWIESHSSQEE